MNPDGRIQLTPDLDELYEVGVVCKDLGVCVCLNERCLKIVEFPLCERYRCWTSDS